MDVSIIVPVFNVENYLMECLDSILSQNFHSMEIICVEDGSTDNSLELLELYEQKYFQIKVIKHDKNRGLSAARNTGLEYATGKYVLFVDSDDILASEALNILWKEAEEKDVDIVYFNYIKFSDSSSYTFNTFQKVWKDYYGVCTGKEFFCSAMRDGELKGEAWRQFIRRDFLIEHQIAFLPGILHEDNLFSFYTIMEAKRVCNLNKNLYYYRQRENSIIRTMDARRAQSVFVILSEIYVYWKIHDFTEEESSCIGKLWATLYSTYKFYQSYGDVVKELQCGDVVEKNIYGTINNLTERKWLNVDELSLDMVRTFDHVIVYGAGRAAQQVVDYLTLKDIVVTCIMVENKKTNPSKFCGLSVYEVQECLGISKISIVIIAVTSKYSEGIESMLRNSGYKNIVKMSDAIVSC